MRSVFKVFHPNRPSAYDLQSIHESQQDQQLTYEGVGLTLGEMPSDYHHLKAERVVGSGNALMERGREAIRTWTAQAQMKLVLHPQVPDFAEGSVLVFALPLSPTPFWATGACRIVKIVDEPQHFGFVYGTLPHHPESGEESFLVHHHDDDRVSFTVTAFSRANALPMRAAGPVGRIIQARAAEVYLDGYEQFAQHH
jgi:uncharacterized protein (UPF0548 family)